MRKILDGLFWLLFPKRMLRRTIRRSAVLAARAQVLSAQLADVIRKRDEGGKVR